MNLERAINNMKTINKFFIIFFTSLFLVLLLGCGKEKKEVKDKVHTELGLFTSDPYFSDESFVPTIRFTVSSDVHTGNTRSKNAQAVTRMINFVDEYMKSSPYKVLDATLFAGDIADNGSEMLWNAFKEELYNRKDENTEALIVMGNHDFRSYFDNSESRFSELFNTPSDFHKVINGFHFICLSPSDETSFSKEKVEWLDKELEQASIADPNKPIFVMQHMNVAGTIVGSDGWGVSNLTGVLSKYPQVVDFSGHSHFSIKDPRSIYQGSFTALGTGTMFYYETGLLGYKKTGLYPIDEFGSFSESAQNALSGVEFYIVEVDKENAVRITGVDLISNTIILRYGIKNPSNKDSFTYTSKRFNESSSPYFLDDYEIEATIYDDSFILKVSQAYSHDLIESYSFEVVDEENNKKMFYTLSGYYMYPMPEYVMVTLNGLKSATKYTINIYAITCYGNRNDKPLSITLTTK